MADDDGTDQELVIEARPRYATRRDANQAEIMADLRVMGARVEDCSTVPDSVIPGDILVYWYHVRYQAWIWQPFEIKVEDGELTPQQEENEPAIPVARCAEDVARWYRRID